jgi:hypothetical protein
VLAVLRSCLDTGPVLVAIDDVQWLDAGTVEALVFAVRRIATGPLGVLLAARTDAAVLSGVVAEAEGRVTAAHPLIGAAAVESLPPGRRVGIFRLLAETATSPETHAHFAALAAGPRSDPRVADALDAAAEAAHARAANAAAGQFAVRAVTFTPESDPAALVRRCIRAGNCCCWPGTSTARSSTWRPSTPPASRPRTWNARCRC